LKIIEPHRLRELIYEDIRTYKKCSISEISKRIGPEISRYKIRQQLQALIDAGRIVKEGASSATVYLVKNGGE
jgi:ATP-dependent DNA helicase RecG